MFVVSLEEVQGLMAAVGSRIVTVWHQSDQLAGGPVAIVMADAFVAGAVGVTSACRALRSSGSDATQQQDVARTAKAAASGTLDSTFV